MYYKTSPFVYFRQLTEQKRRNGQDSTADLYRASINHFFRFQERDPIRSFRDITVERIERFRKYLQSRGLRTNSVNSYLANLRAMYNRALQNKIAPNPHEYPFAGLAFRAEKTPKRSLRRQLLMQIASLPLEDHPAWQQALDYGLFSYLGCGIPFADLARLTEANIQGNELVYHRVKTGVCIRIGLTAGMRRILGKYRREGGTFLFPILHPEAGYKEYKIALRRQNNHLKGIGSLLPGRPVMLTTYVFRHSWATEAHRQHTPIGIISQALGHTSEKTTRVYLDQLDQSAMNKANKQIVGELDRMVR